jgi:hypothetical protein
VFLAGLRRVGWKKVRCNNLISLTFNINYDIAIADTWERLSDWLTCNCIAASLRYTPVNLLQRTSSSCYEFRAETINCIVMCFCLHWNWTFVLQQEPASDSPTTDTRPFIRKWGLAMLRKDMQRSCFSGPILAFLLSLAPFRYGQVSSSLWDHLKGKHCRTQMPSWSPNKFLKQTLLDLKQVLDPFLLLLTGWRCLLSLEKYLHPGTVHVHLNLQVCMHHLVRMQVRDTA